MTDENDMQYVDMVSVWAGSGAEGEVIRAVLAAHGLRVITDDWLPSGGIFPSMMSQGGMKVKVLAPYAESAAQMIENARKEAAGELDPIRVLFVCTHNKFRSQMAEGLLDALGGGRFEVYSAGAEPQGPSPIAVRLMDEIGIDISDHTGHHVNEYLGEKFDYVITVCADANESCPAFPGVGERLHWSFDDPSKFTGTPEEIEKKMRVVREAIREKVLELIRTAKPQTGREKL
jgi:arsenate reductase